MIGVECSNICLIINTILWTCVFVGYQCKTRYFSTGSGILLMYTIISVGAIHLYNYYPKEFEQITMFPFIYLLCMILLATYPILTIGESKITHIQAPNIQLFNIVCIGVIILSIIGLPRTIHLIQENMMAIIFEGDEGVNIYREAANNTMSKTESGLNIVAILSNACGNVSLVLLMYYITVKHINKILLIGLIISSLIGPLGGLANGGRALMAVYIFNVVFMVVFIRKMLSSNIKKKLLRIVVVAIVLFMIPFITLTLSRNSGDFEKTLLSIESYTSQGFLKFNNYGLDAGGTRNGDYTAVALKKILGLNPAMYYSGRVNKYSHMKMNESVFYTFVGDFTLDYGPILAIIIFIATSCFFKRCLKVRNNTIAFHQLLLFYLLMVGCLGYFQWPLGREAGNIQMIIIFLLAALFKLDFDLKKHKIA